MIPELVVIALGIVCSLPVIFEDYIDNFEAGEWQTWAKLTPQLFLSVSIGFSFFKKLHIYGLVFSVLGLIATYMSLLFNSRASASSVCEEWPDVCPEKTETLENETCKDIAFEPIEGFLYLFGLCLMTAGSVILIRDLAMKVKEKKSSTNN